jgi:hypothetical protein
MESDEIRERAKRWLKLASCKCAWCDRITYVGNKRIEPELCPIEKLRMELEEAAK